MERAFAFASMFACATFVGKRNQANRCKWSTTTTVKEKDEIEEAANDNYKKSLLPGW